MLAQYESDVVAIRQVLDEILIQYSKGNRLTTVRPAAYLHGIHARHRLRKEHEKHGRDTMAMARKQPAVVSRVQGGSRKVQQHIRHLERNGEATYVTMQEDRDVNGAGGAGKIRHKRPRVESDDEGC